MHTFFPFTRICIGLSFFICLSLFLLFAPWSRRALQCSVFVCVACSDFDLGRSARYWPMLTFFEQPGASAVAVLVRNRQSL